MSRTDSTGEMGPMSEAGVGLVCQDCSFQSTNEAKADAHYSLTGHLIAIDYTDRESEWPELNNPNGYHRG
jgi:hypothetical protein